MMNDSLKNTKYGTIRVPWAVLWSTPETDPKICHLAAKDIAAWSKNLHPEERLALVGKVETTALFGERVIILAAQGDWVHVAITSQSTQKNVQGYPGWVPASQIVTDDTYLAEQLTLPEAVVFAAKGTLFGDPTLTQPVCELSYQVRLPILREERNSFQVRLPDGRTGSLSHWEAKRQTDLFFDREDITQDAQRFVGLPYLWGGTSSDGFDCSGFTFRLYQSQGIRIPRDAVEQANMGDPVPKEGLLPSDLLFFSNDGNVDGIHHVAMYIGDGLMIHSPNSKSVIRIEAMDSGIYGREYWGARRYSPATES